MMTIPLMSWDFVHTGALAWDDAGRSTPCDVPRGVEVSVEPCVKTSALFPLDRPWEAGHRPAWAQVLHEDGRYRLWYAMIQSVPVAAQRLCYAESEDGLNWHKPSLGIVEHGGSQDNNICSEAPGIAHFSISRNPHEIPEKRYQCMIFRSWWEGAPGERLDDDEGHRRLDAKNAACPGDKILPVSLKGKMFGMVSPDGLRWVRIEQPILDEWHDTHNILVYDASRRLYRAYLRGFYGGRRSVAYTETTDFEDWPASRVIHHAIAGDRPDESLYSNAYTTYPGRPDIHLMFPAIYRQGEDTTYGQLAVSLDGLNWSRVVRQAIIPHGHPGSNDEGMTYPEPHLVRDGGKFRLLCLNGRIYHNQWYNETLRAQPPSAYYAWAEWPEDRLAGIAAAGEGQFTIMPQPCGDRLLANYRTAPDGWIRFELVDRLVWPPKAIDGIEGFLFAQSDALQGDRTHEPVSWSGSADLSRLKGQSLAIRVRLYRATLFSVTMYGIDEPDIADDPRYPV